MPATEGLNRKTWNANPSRDLSYTSLVIDEQNRAQHSHKITDTARFHATPVNGNVASLIPNIDEDGVRDSLPKFLRADTTTRTVFRDVFYDAKDTIADILDDPLRSFNSVRSQPHVPLNELASVDTRIRKLKPPYDRVLGPGSYVPDPLGERATGTLTVSPGEVHRTVQYARDPRRPSAAFLSPTRGRTAPEIAAAAVAPPVVSRMSEPDFEYWTRKGCWSPRQERVIEAERWGKNAREVLPAAEDRPQSMYDPAVTTDGHPNSCEAYTSARLTPAYKVAFASGLPRTLALPLGTKPDTRLLVKRYDDVTAARPDVGPGSYNPEAPRLRSNNAAYETADPYYSLASGTPQEPGSHDHSATTPSGASLASLLPPQLQQQLAAAGTLSLLTPATAPSTPHGGTMQRRGLAPLALPGGGSAGANARSAPTSPSAARAAAVRAERQAAASLMASLPGSRQGHGGGGSRGRGSPPGSSRVFGSGGGGGLGGLQQILQGAQQLLDEDGAGGGLGGIGIGGLMGGGGGSRLQSPAWSRGQAAAAAAAGGSMSASMRAAQAKQFTKLVFMQRHTPCSSLLRSRLIVAADLRKERQRLRNPQ
ncbi:hypothetical protein PLESTB_000498000 [Pleodorina starrii]|uniref:Uncharacterized protein n=1 Tax=Pleodorina starrii TaxID=330485 RepID=A0A9W6BG31_9CHLO|nr:hypothetical protein PLESTM_000369400 [Pleodorina starrii]GLC51399.1 hypothetical protein PLESTB_000498000 [Pleodorina starrii]GLC63765.1 hypothetical protein PLESTF_000071600 [Pleodorina starrii]